MQQRIQITDFSARHLTVLLTWPAQRWESLARLKNRRRLDLCDIEVAIETESC